MTTRPRASDGTYHLLTTASREWTDKPGTGRRHRMRSSLIAVWRWLGCPPPREITVVDGDARGGDKLIQELARELGMRSQQEPCTDEEWRRHGNPAGHIRNARMITKWGPFVGCLAFPLGESKGTRGCMKLAKNAGIPVWNRGDLDPHTTMKPPPAPQETISGLW